MQAQTQRPAPALFTRPALARLIIPLVIELFLLMAVGMADTVMVTSAGEAAVSGVSLVDQVNTLVIQVFTALSTGGAVVVSQYLGRQEGENANAAAKQLLYAAAAVSGALTLLALALRGQVLSAVFGQVEDAVMDSALVYFLLTALAYPFIAVYNAGAALFRSMGNSKVSMFCSLSVNIINIAVNAVLIYGFGMGAAGAGIGTLASRIAAAGTVLALLRHPDNVVRAGGLLQFRFQWQMVRRILFIGIPTGLENGMFQAGKLMVLNLVAGFGTAAVAANAIASSIAAVGNVPGQAIGLALVTVVGRCMGAGDSGQAAAYTRRLMGAACLCMLVMGAGQFFLAGWLVTLFNLSQEAMLSAARVLRLCAIFNIVFWPMSFVMPNALRAAGDVVFTMAVALCSMFACRVALSYVLACPWGLGLGLVGVWLAMFCDWAVRACLFLARFWRGKWKHHQAI